MICPSFKKNFSSICGLVSLFLLTSAVGADDNGLIRWEKSDIRKPRPILRADGKAVFLRELYSLRRAEDFNIAAFMGFNAVIEDGSKTFENHGSSWHDSWETFDDWREGIMNGADGEPGTADDVRDPCLPVYRPGGGSGGGGNPPSSGGGPDILH